MVESDVSEVDVSGARDIFPAPSMLETTSSEDLDFPVLESTVMPSDSENGSSEVDDEDSDVSGVTSSLNQHVDIPSEEGEECTHYESAICSGFFVLFKSQTVANFFH